MSAASTYNRVGPSFFLDFGKLLAGETEVTRGSRILDIGTGTGAALIPAAQLACEEGRAVGIDVSPAMIRRARAEVEDSGLNNAIVFVAEGESLPFPESSFDRVLCSFAIFLFSNLSGLLSECHRVLESTGRIGLAYSAGDDPDWHWYEQLKSRYAPTADLGTERYSSQQVESTMKQLGFMNIGTRIEAHTIVFSDASEFWGWSWSHGDRAVLQSLTGNGADFKRELFEEVARRATANGLVYRVFAAITLGTKRGAG
jgi:O-methyltransferase / aklanonic acid methyltransferase